MTETLCTAARKTTQILDLTDRARIALYGGETPANTVGVLADPAVTLDNLKAARDLIERAIALHVSTNWPDRNDYHAL